MAESLIASIVVFVLATFLGVELIGRVPPTLHTPLMSGANAVSGITVVGALIVAGRRHGWISSGFGFVAIVVRDDERGRRLRRDRPHARHVPRPRRRRAAGRRPAAARRGGALMPAWLAQLGYLVAAVPVRRRPQAARPHRHGARRQPALGRRDAARRAGHAARPGDRVVHGDRRGARGGHRARPVDGARREDDAMPQMVALLNGLGGAASLLVSGAELLRAAGARERLAVPTGVAIQLGTLIGAVTLTGSVVAFAKLQELMTGRPVTYRGQQVVNGLVFAAILGVGVWQVATPDPLPTVFWIGTALALVLGVGLVLPIGGADMPVVISLLNSYSGIAAAMTGFVINNSVLIISGALVGSSGIILSQLMCRAMNRSLTNVLFGAFGAAPTASSRTAEGLVAKPITAEDAALQLAYAARVIIVPGYGMAVAQSQHQVRELADLIEKRGGDVKYAIHPVAGACRAT
jgi:hypothetical protein